VLHAGVVAGLVDPRVPERIVRELERHGIDG